MHLEIEYKELFYKQKLMVISTGVSMKNKKEKPIFVIVGIVFFILCFLLYYCQSIKFGGQYNSDLSLHISMADKQNKASYSVFILLIQFLKWISFDSTILIALFLAAITIGTVWATKRLLEVLFPQFQQKLYWGIAFLSILIMPIHIPKINNWYLGLWVGNVWHNPTYLCMRFFGIIILTIFYKIFAENNGKISKRNWIVLAILLILVNAFKPNFVLCLVPALGFYLLYLLFKQRWKNVKDVICIVMAFVPCAFVLLIQYIIMYGATEEGGIGIRFAYFLTSRSLHPLIGILQSMIFPIIVLVYSYWSKQIRKSYVFTWLMWLIGLMQYLLLIEQGSRMNHGNWTWGFYFCMYILFMYSMGIFFKNCSDCICGQNKTTMLKIYCGTGAICLLLYIISGGLYFVRLLLGCHYY